MVRLWFFPLVVLLLVNSFWITVLKCKFGKCFNITIISSVFVLYLSQLLLNSFKYGMATIYFSMILGGGFLVYGILKKNYIYKNFFSNGLIVFFIIIVVVYFYNYKRFIWNSDEFSHWGMMVKEMFRLDSFYSDPESRLLVHKEYPPFAPLLELLWVKLAGAYSEARITVALHVFEFGLLVMAICEDIKGNIIKKIIFFLSQIVLFVLLLSSFDLMDTFNTIYTDILISVIFAHVIYIIFTGIAFNEISGRIDLILSVLALIFTKQMAITFVGLIIFMIFLKIISFRKNIKLKKEIVYLGIMILSILIVKYSWKNYFSRYVDGGQFGLSKIDISALPSIFSGTDQGIRYTTYVSFVKALFSRVLSSGLFELNYISTCIIGFIGIYLLYIGFKSYIDKKDIVIINVIHLTGMLGYAFTMCVLYLFCFSEGEMNTLASYERYMASYIVAIITAIVMLFIHYSSLLIDINYKHISIVLLISILIFDNTKFFNLAPQWMRTDYYLLDRMYGEFVNNNTVEESRIFLIGTGSSQQKLTYLFDNRILDNIIFDIENVDISNYENYELSIREDNYILVTTVTDEVKDFLNQFTDDEIKDNTLYTITQISGSDFTVDLYKSM